MKKILVLTDFSDHARNAVLFALKAFPPERHEYMLLNAYDRIWTPSLVPGTGTLSERMRAESQEALKSEEQQINGSYGKEVNFEKLSFLGFLSEAVNTLNKERNIDLVVMGTRGAGGQENVLLGSKASSLVKAILVPLLIIPENASFGGFKDIVLAANLETLMKPEHLTPLSHLADEFDSNLSVLTVGRGEESPHLEHTEEAEKLKEHFHRNNIAFMYEHSRGREEGIEHYAHEHACDLLVIVERSRNYLIDLFHRSLSKDLVLHTDIPVLVLHG